MVVFPISQSGADMSHKNGTRRAKHTKVCRTVEHRAFVRHACGEEGSCHSIQPGSKKVWLATIRDVSIAGLSLVVRHPFSKGEILAIELQNSVEGLSRQRLFVRVMHSTSNSDRNWVVGCCFVNKLADYELQTLLQPPPS